MLLTGDLTDAKAANDVTSKQFEEEWKIYRQVIDYCQAQIPVTFLDIRGNHGVFLIQRAFFTLLTRLLECVFALT